MINLFKPAHPGEFIREMYMEPLEISAVDLADRLRISQSTLSRIINGKTDLSSEMALRLSKVLGRSAESWSNMQTKYNLAKVGKVMEKELENLSRIAY